MHYITLNSLNSKKLFKNLNGLTLNEIMESNQAFHYMLQYIEAHKVGKAHYSIIASEQHIAAFKEMSQRYKAVGNTVFDLTRLISTSSSDLLFQTSTPETNALPRDQLAIREHNQKYRLNASEYTALGWSEKN